MRICVRSEAVDRNRARFPGDFQFRLTPQEAGGLISQIAISKAGRRGGRAFVRLRRLHGDHADLARRIDELEGAFDYRFRIVFDAIRALQAPPNDPSLRPPIGFRP